jgi:hypothetical protein
MTATLDSFFGSSQHSDFGILSKDVVSANRKVVFGLMSWFPRSRLENSLVSTCCMIIWPRPRDDKRLDIKHNSAQKSIPIFMV